MELDHGCIVLMSSDIANLTRDLEKIAQKKVVEMQHAHYAALFMLLFGLQCSKTGCASDSVLEIAAAVTSCTPTASGKIEPVSIFELPNQSQLSLGIVYSLASSLYYYPYITELRLRAGAFANSTSAIEVLFRELLLTPYCSINHLDLSRNDLGHCKAQLVALVRYVEHIYFQQR